MAIANLWGIEYNLGRPGHFVSLDQIEQYWLVNIEEKDISTRTQKDYTSRLQKNFKVLQAHPTEYHEFILAALNTFEYLNQFILYKFTPGDTTIIKARPKLTKADLTGLKPFLIFNGHTFTNLFYNNGFRIIQHENDSYIKCKQDEYS
jgi:hypothetical protein